MCIYIFKYMWVVQISGRYSSKSKMYPSQLCSVHHNFGLFSMVFRGNIILDDPKNIIPPAPAPKR